MNFNEQDFTEFEGLIVELENQDNHPSAPNLATETKNELRRDLLKQHKAGGLSRQAVGNLWKFAGTAVAAFLILFFIAGLIAVLSNRTTQVGPSQGVDSAPTRTPIPANEEPSTIQMPDDSMLSSFAELNDLSREAIAIGNRIQLLSYEVTPAETGSILQLKWLPLALVDEKFQLFVHVIDKQGNLIFQADTALYENMPVIGQESEEATSISIPIPTNEMLNGLYDISLGLYDSESGERLSVSAMNPVFIADNETAVQLTDGLFVNNEDEPTVAESEIGGDNRNATIQFGESLILSAYTTQQEAGQMSLSFDWIPIRFPMPDYSLTIQLVTPDGELIAQEEIPLLSNETPTSEWETVGYIDGMIHTEQILSLTELPENQYDLLISLTNNTTGERVPVTTTGDQQVQNDDTAVRLLTWNEQNPEDRIWIISVSPEFGSSLKDPSQERVNVSVVVGYDLYSAESAQFEFWLDPAAEGQATPAIVGFTPPVREISRGSGRINNSMEILQHTIGGVTAAIIPHIQLVTPNKTITLPPETLAEAIWSLTDLPTTNDRVWLISATQKERATSTDAVNIDVVLGYQLVSEPQATIELFSLSPAWDDASGNAPIAISEEQSILNGNGQVEFSITVDPGELSNLLASDQLVLQASIAHIVDTNNGPQQQNILRERFTRYFLDLSRTSEITHMPDQVETALSAPNSEESGQVSLVSITQKERPSADAPIEIEYTIGYQFESNEDVFIKMSYGDENWENMGENGRLPIDGLDNPIFLDSNQGELTLTTTINPSEAKQITQTDNPVLIAEMGYIIPHDDERGNEFVYLAQDTFTDYPLDLTNINAIHHPSNDPLLEHIIADRVAGLELGGQTRIFDNAEAMQYAGMNWVKFQYDWVEGDNPGDLADLIQAARDNNMKVLLSISGADNSSINYDAYTEFLEGVTTLGPDAIEVWRNMNIDREWPSGQIDPAIYTNQMLAPAYNAIKEVNPNVMVISGALAPTGFFNGCNEEGCDDDAYLEGMATAGAANYLDCVGVHFTQGVIPPYQLEADPRSDHHAFYLSDMVDIYFDAFNGSRQLCFTELGYLSGEGLAPLSESFAWANETTVAQQADWLAEATSLLNDSNIVRLLIVFNVDHTHYTEDDPQAGYSIIRPDGSCPACEALHETMSNESIMPTNANTIEIVSISPQPGATIQSNTTFELTLSYDLNDIPESEIMVSMFPIDQGGANMSELIQPITRGTGMMTLSFDFIPMDTAVASDWHLIVRLVPADYDNLGEAMQNTILTITPHEGENSEPYYYRP